MGFTGLYFNYKANLNWRFGWYVDIKQYGAYDYYNGNEERCGVRLRFLGKIRCKSKFRALLLKTRINKQQLKITINKNKLSFQRIKK